MKTCTKAAEGLKLLFISEIVKIVGVFLALIPFVGPIVMVVASIIGLLGLKKAQEDHAGYHTAFIFMIANLVANVVSIFVGGSLSTVLSVVSTILILVVVFNVINSTCILAGEAGKDEFAEKGKKLWKFYLFWTVLGIVASILTFLPALAGIVALVAIIFELIAYIRYLIFLNKGSKELA